MEWWSKKGTILRGQKTMVTEKTEEEIAESAYKPVPLGAMVPKRGDVRITPKRPRIR